MTNISTKEIKAKILKDRGLAVHKPAKHKQQHIVPSAVPAAPLTGKTTMMELLELKHHKLIRELLLAGSLSVVAKKLGVDASTVSKWKKKLKLVYTAGNLPQCDGCPQYQHHQQLCDVGLCTILYELELYDLIPLKQKELMDGQEYDQTE